RGACVFCRRPGSGLLLVNVADGHAVLNAEDGHERADGAGGEDQTDEKQDRAEHFVPLQVHEVEDHVEELHQREDGEGGDQQPSGQGQVDQDDFHAGDERQQHGDLHEDVEFAVLGVGGVVAVGVVGSGGGSAHFAGALGFSRLGFGISDWRSRSEVFEQVNDGEDDDPDDVHEVPVKAHGFDVDGVGLAEVFLGRGAGHQAAADQGDGGGDQRNQTVAEVGAEGLAGEAVLEDGVGGVEDGPGGEDDGGDDHQHVQQAAEGPAFAAFGAVMGLVGAHIHHDQPEHADGDVAAVG